MILKFLELVNSSKLMGATNTLTCKFSSVTERLFRFQTLIFDGSLERSTIVVLEKRNSLWLPGTIQKSFKSFSFGRSYNTNLTYPEK